MHTKELPAQKGAVPMLQIARLKGERGHPHFPNPVEYLFFSEMWRPLNQA